MSDLLEFPSLSFETFISEPSLDEMIPDDSRGSLRFGIMGIGQAGGRIAEMFMTVGYKKCIYVNTTDQDLNKVIYTCLTKIPGRPGGAGKNMEIAQKAFSYSENNIFELMQKVYGKVDHILICAALGGGTGCGSIIPAIALAKKYMAYIDHSDVEKRVGAIVTLPTNGERGPVVLGNTLSTIKTLSEMADAKKISPLVMVDNEQLKKMYRSVPIAQHHAAMNSTIVQLFDYFNLLSKQASSYTTFDSTDYQSIMQAGGHMLYGMIGIKPNVYRQGEGHVDKSTFCDVFRQNATSALLSTDFDLSTAKIGGVIALVDEELIHTDTELQTYLEYGFDSIGLMCPQATIHRGLYSTKVRDNQAKIRIFTILSGLQTPTNKYSYLTARI